MLTKEYNIKMNREKDKRIINLSEAARILETSENITRRKFLTELMELDYSTQLPSGHFVFLSEEVRKYAESRN